jgi:hypothetical protein
MQFILLVPQLFVELDSEFQRALSASALYMQFFGKFDVVSVTNPVEVLLLE